MKNIMFCSCGRRVQLFKFLKDSLGDSCKIIATDNQSIAPALYVADEHYLTPRIDDPNYINTILKIAQIKRMAAACWTNYEATLPKDSLSKITDNTTNKDNKTTQLKNISTIINSLISTMLLPSTTPDNVKDIIKKKRK